MHIADYRFNATAAKDLHSSQYSNNTSSKDVKHSGYYQIDVPQSYSTSQGKIVFLSTQNTVVPCYVIDVATHHRQHTVRQTTSWIVA